MQTKDRTFIPCDRPVLRYQLFRSSLQVQPYFGPTEAEIDEDDDLDPDLFVHTGSYDVIKPDHLLLIFGRRGTGKTALIRMLDYEVRAKLSNTYTYSSILSQEKLFLNLTMAVQLHTATLNDLQRAMIFQRKWTWAINTAAMHAIYSQSNADDWSDEHNSIARYLASVDIVQEIREPSTSPLNRILDLLISHLGSENSSQSGNEGSSFDTSMKFLETSSYREALNSMWRLLNSRDERCLVLLDSQEFYDFNDKIAAGCVAGLIDALFEAYRESHRHRVSVKAALHSEIERDITSTHYHKFDGKKHFILWQYRDLVELVAKRYAHLLLNPRYSSLTRSGNVTTSTIERIHREDPLLYLQRFIPERTVSFSDIEFATLPYILSHTQKTPRQLIQLLNIIMSLGVKNKIPIDKLTSECIREGTNAMLVVLSNSLLSLYNNVYPGIQELAERTFQGAPNILNLSSLHQRFQESKGYLRRQDQDRDSAMKLFVQAGIVGVIEDEQELYGGAKTLIQARFEYQRSGMTHLTNDMTLAVHPMFYQGFRTHVDLNSLVYPIPSDEEREEQEEIAAQQRIPR